MVTPKSNALPHEGPLNFGKVLTAIPLMLCMVANCIKCSEQGVGSTFCWKPRLRNYKAHIKANKKTCRIVRHFIEKCFDDDEQLRLNPGKYMRFHIIDCLDNVDGLSTEEIDELLLEKEKLWIRNLVTIHKGMNSHHDLNRGKRCDRDTNVD